MSDLDNAVEEMALKVMQAQAAAIVRGGVLNLWTVFRRPRDFPDAFVARRFEVGRARAAPVATTDILHAPGNRLGLALLRRAFVRSGLTRIRRNADDELQIVETWL